MNPELNLEIGQKLQSETEGPISVSATAVDMS